MLLKSKLNVFVRGFIQETKQNILQKKFDAKFGEFDLTSNLEILN